jgi:hypothetical protein
LAHRHKQPIRRCLDVELLVVDPCAPGLRRVDRSVAILIVAVGLLELLLPDPTATGTLALLDHAAKPVQGVVIVGVFHDHICLVQGRVLGRNPCLRIAQVAIVVCAALAPEMIAAEIENQASTIPVPGIVNAAQPRVKELPAYVVERLVCAFCLFWNPVQPHKQFLAHT